MEAIAMTSPAVEREEQPTEQILKWAAKRFSPRVAMATGFGLEGCVLIHMIAQAKLPVQVFTLDTGLFFEETYELWRRLESRYDIEIRGVKPSLSLAEQSANHGKSLWETQPNLCCKLRKVDPLRAHKAKYDAWITAIRRDQTPERAVAKVVEYDEKFDLFKVNPLLRWTARDIQKFIDTHDIPYNALHDQGYPSIGCAPCTSRVAAGEDPRAGRWRGIGKTECGLHGRFTTEEPTEPRQDKSVRESLDDAC
jgi:phosphoadenosine phosphosulfate reductase